MGNRAELGRVFVQAFKRFYYDLEPDAQARAIETAMSQALAVARPVLAAHCEVAQRIGQRLGLSEEIRRNLGQIYERWDGKGLPRGLSGGDVLPAVRLITLAQDINGGEIVGEEYFPLDTVDFRRTVQEIMASGAEVVFNTLVPPGLTPFLDELHKPVSASRAARPKT